MIVRTALGVMVTAALIGAVHPAISIARTDAAGSSLDRQLTALGDRLDRLVATNDPTVGPGARYVTTLRVPDEGQTNAGIDAVAFRTRSGIGIASWRVRDGTTHHIRLVGVPIRASEWDMTLNESGRHRLGFALRSESGAPVIRVRRMGGGP